jgi:cell division septum initiation protein DivIVA
MDELTPEQIAARGFRQAFRGADLTEVKEFLSLVAGQFGELIAQRDRLAGRLGEFAERDLRSEFVAVGEEISGVLEAARTAAEGMRERGATDSARWRTEAMAEAEIERRSAREDAEHLRTDAWHTGEELLRQAQLEAKRLVEAAERDSLSVLGEAEREAHRLAATGRREAEDVTRAARMEAERINAEATARHNEIIESARRQAETAQERARALEQRRLELMAELETLRSSLSRMEGELDERRTRLEVSATDDAPDEPPQVAAGRPGHDAETWEPGETVRVIPRRRTPDAPAVPDPGVAVERPRRSPDIAAKGPPGLGTAAAVESAQQVVEAVPAPDEGPTPPAPVRPTVPGAAEGPATDEVSDIFSRLRGAPRSSVPSPSTPGDEGRNVTAVVKPKVSARATSVDPFELRQRLLLPVSNRALRNLKRQLTEIQNDTLEELRVSGAGWRPQSTPIEEQIRPDVVVLMAESFSMGHNAAEQMMGLTFPRPPTPLRDEASGMAAALAEQLGQVLSGAGEEGGRETAASISRVFRGWRTDEAERRVSDLASSAYHDGLQATLAGGQHVLGWVVSGRGCARCREAAENIGEAAPPLHPGCGCTLVPATG